MKKLFISFTETLAEMAAGTITAVDFKDALFYFGCIRGHAMDPWKCPKPGSREPTSNEVTWFYKDEATGRAAHKILKKALRKAEREGRAVWRRLKQPNTFTQLNDLLRRNKVSILPDWQEYTYPTVCDAIVAARLPIELVYNRLRQHGN